MMEGVRPFVNLNEFNILDPESVIDSNTARATIVLVLAFVISLSNYVFNSLIFAFNAAEFAVSSCRSWFVRIVVLF